jgi:hypothetical protein
MSNKLLSSLFQYPSKSKKHFMISFENLSFTLDDKKEVLEEIESWLSSGVHAPTARESADGWHKKSSHFGVQGDGGSVCISRLITVQGIHNWRGIDLDQWVPN